MCLLRITAWLPAWLCLFAVVGKQFDIAALAGGCRAEEVDEQGTHIVLVAVKTRIAVSPYCCTMSGQPGNMDTVWLPYLCP